MFKIIDIPTDTGRKEELLNSFIELIGDNIKKGIYQELLNIIEGRVFKSSLANVEFRNKAKIFCDIKDTTDDYSKNFKKIKKTIIPKITSWIISHPEYFVNNIGKTNISNYALQILLIRILLDHKYKDKKFLINKDLQGIQLIVYVEQEKEHLVSITQIQTEGYSIEHNVNSFFRDILQKNRTTGIGEGIEKVITLFAKKLYHRVKNKNMTFNNVKIISMIISEISKSEYTLNDNFIKLIKRKEDKENNTKLQFVDILYKSVLKINKFNSDNLGNKKYLNNNNEPCGFFKEFLDITEYNFEEREKKKSLEIKKQTLTIKKFKEEMKNIMEIYPLIIYKNTAYGNYKEFKIKSDYNFSINKDNLNSKIIHLETSFNADFNRYLSTKYYTFNMVFNRTEIINFFKLILEYDTLGYITQESELKEMIEHKFFKLAVTKNIIKIENGLNIISKKSIKYKNQDKKISSFSKSLNTRKNLNFKTLALFKSIIPVIRLFEENANSYYIGEDMFFSDKLIYIIKVFEKLGISEKKYRAFIHKFLQENLLFKKINISDSIKINQLNTGYIHDILDDIFTNNKFLNNILIEVKNNKWWSSNTKKIFINKFIDNIISMNINSGNLDKYYGLFEVARRLIKTNLTESEVLQLNKMEDYNRIYWDKKEKVISDKVEVLSNDFSINKETLEVSKQMNNIESFLNLLNLVKKTDGYLDKFNTDNKFIDFDKLEIIKEHYQVNIFPHNNYLSILGTSVHGVCIDIDSLYKAEQLNNNYINLIVKDKKGVPILWGLLAMCYSVIPDSDEQKYYYVLNNLQGSINNNKIKGNEVHIDIMELFSNLITDEYNNIENIFTKEQFFNTIDITENLSTFQPINKIYLPEKPRLDFQVSDKKEILFQEQTFFKVI